MVGGTTKQSIYSKAFKIILPLSTSIGIEITILRPFDTLINAFNTLMLENIQ